MASLKQKIDANEEKIIILDYTKFEHIKSDEYSFVRKVVPTSVIIRRKTTF